MNWMISMALLITPVLAVAQTSQPAWQTLAQGQLMLMPFDHAPYPHVSREKGWKYQDEMFPKEGHYDDSTVGIFIPSGYVPGDKVNYVVHFHGWENHVANVIPEYKLAEQLVDAKVNAILLVPQGPKDAKDSGGGKLELDPGAFGLLIEEVTEFLYHQGKVPKPNVGDIILSTHSGGYKVTAGILDHGGLTDHISDVLLLDSSYGSLERFVAWSKASPTHRLISTYTDHLAKTNEELIGLMKQADVKVQTLDEANVTDEQLASPGATFFHTKGPHNDVPVMYFGRFLATSPLARQATTQPVK